MALKKGIKELVAAAEAEIETMSADEAKAAEAGGEATIVDLRDVRELWRTGKAFQEMPRVDVKVRILPRPSLCSTTRGASLLMRKSILPRALLSSKRI